MLPSAIEDDRILLTFQPLLAPNFTDSEGEHSSKISLGNMRRPLEFVGLKTIGANGSTYRRVKATLLF